MKAVLLRQESGELRVRVGSLSQLDELVGTQVTHEVPETAWGDSNALFQFESKEEAQEAIHDTYYHLFFPKAAWDETEVVEVKHFHPYSSDLSFAWQVVEQMSVEGLTLEMRREGRNWLASFGHGSVAAAQTAPLAICLAGLSAHGIKAILELNHDLE